ncbi:MAG: protoporphyrinogen oxidase [Candidatus Baltobacteraceae bacterium]
MPRVAVLGGGISGLIAAHRLQELAQESGMALEIAVYERDAQAGGCLRTVRENGLVMELGADSLLIGKPAASGLIEHLRLAAEIVEMQPQYRGARLLHGNRLRPIPRDFRLFAPRSLPALLRSGIFSPAGVARAALEPFVPARKETSDESLASFVARRFGREVLERLAQPLVGGIYCADPRRLSMQTALPQFVELEQRYGSVVRGLTHVSRDPQANRLVSLRGGMAALIHALMQRLDGVVYTGVAVEHIERTADGWNVRLAGGRSDRADAIVCALQAPAAAALLRPVDAGIARLLEQIRCNSVATINLVYDGASVRLPPATGFVVPFTEGRRIVAATFSSQKYPHRSSPDEVLVRVFAGGALQENVLQTSDEGLARLAHTELCAVLPVRQAPKRSLVTRWSAVLPEYAPGHQTTMQVLLARSRAIPGINFAGCAYSGVGIPDCVAGAQAAAGSVFGYIRARKELN